MSHFRIAFVLGGFLCTLVNNHKVILEAAPAEFRIAPVDGLRLNDPKMERRQFQQCPTSLSQKKVPIHISPANRFINPMWAPGLLWICLFFSTEKGPNPPKGGSLQIGSRATCESVPSFGR